METVTQEIKKVLYFQDIQAENKKKYAAEAAAHALNNVYKHYKFLKISEIPSDAQAWITKRNLEVNPELAKMAQTHKLESLNFKIPDWILEAGRAFSQWHSVKTTHTQFLQYCALVNEVWVVDEEMLEQEFENSDTYRKYFKTADQLKRLERCKMFISLLEETGITYPYKYISLFKNTMGNPWCRVINDKYVPCVEYILTGEIFPNAPMHRDPGYILLSVLE